MRNLSLAFMFLALLAFAVQGRGLTRVWIGYDGNVPSSVKLNMVSVFSRIPFANATTFLVTDTIAVANALSDAEEIGRAHV